MVSRVRPWPSGHHDASTSNLRANKGRGLHPEPDQRIESAQRAQESLRTSVAPRARRRRRARVLLTVVDLAQLHALVHDPESVTVWPTCNSTIGRRRRRPSGDDARVRSKRPPPPSSGPVRFETHVIVNEEEEGEALDHQHARCTPREPVLVEQPDEGVGGNRGDAAGRARSPRSRRRAA